MWNRRKEEEFTSKPAAMLPSSAELTKEGIPMSTLSGRSMEADAHRGTATIGKSVIIKGNIYSREDLVVDGELEGAIELQEHRLTIGVNGKISSNGVKAREIVVLGTIHGNVEATDKIEIRKDAKLVGDIKTARIVIEDGAYFKGSIDIVKIETGKATAAPTPAPAPKTQAAAAPVNATLPLPGAAGDFKR